MRPDRSLSRGDAPVRKHYERPAEERPLDEQGRALGLTPREREIVDWLARGKTNCEIAAILWVSPGTVRKHLENVYVKLGVHNRTAATTCLLGLFDEKRPEAKGAWDG